MSRPLTLAAYRALLADVAGRHGGVLQHDAIRWHLPDGRPLVVLFTLALADLTLRPAMSVGASVILPSDPARALSDLDAARATLERAIAARDELAGVVVDVSRSTT